MAVLMSVLSLLSFKLGYGLSGTCTPVCSGSHCVTVNQDRVDFKTAEETCRDMNGELMTFQGEAEESILDIVSQGLSGNFWIGLRLPAGACSNLSAPLRGYEWTSDSTHGSFVPSLTTWKGSVKVCSPHCVTLSDDQRMTEMLCSDKAAGFLCRTKPKDACRSQLLSDTNFFKSSKGCSYSPCEHNCKDVSGGFKCSCYQGYIPDRKDPRRCKLYCGQMKCRMTCERNNECYCPDGYIENGRFCEDIDECSMDQCDHKCKNTFGGFVCSCKEGFVLKGKVKCIKAEDKDSFVITTPITIGLIEPAVNNNTLKASAAPAGGFLWIWIFVALTMIVLIFMVRFYVVKRQRLREQNSNQQSTATAAVDNI